MKKMKKYEVFTQSLDMLLSSDFVLDVREEAVNAVFCVYTDTE